MKQLQKRLNTFFNFFQKFWPAFVAGCRRILPNIHSTWKWFGDLLHAREEARAKMTEYFLWHRKELLFCVLLAFLMVRVDKVQQFFSAFSRDIIEGPPSLGYFSVAFIGNALIIFWMCYVFWHKPKRTTLLIGLFGRKKAESYHRYYKSNSNAWRIATTASLPLLLAGAGLALSIIQEHIKHPGGQDTMDCLGALLTGHPMLTMLGIAVAFFLLTQFFQPNHLANPRLVWHMDSLWRNLFLMLLCILLLLGMFWGYHNSQANWVYKAGALSLLVFLPPLILTFLLNAFSRCLIKSAQILDQPSNKKNEQTEGTNPTESPEKGGSPRLDIIRARRFSRTYDVLMWSSYLASGIVLLMVNVKDVTGSLWFSQVFSPIAMLIFIAIAYYLAIDWLSYNMTPARFTSLMIIMTLLVWFGPQKHYEIKYKAPPVLSKAERVPLEQYFYYWLKDRMDHHLLDTTARQNIYLVATEGGGSRAGAWTSAVLTGLDEAMEGKFKQQCFAISGISGGSIGAAGTLALWDNAGRLPGVAPNFYVKDSVRVRYIKQIFERNYISTALAGLFFTDGFQQNILFSWLFTAKYSRTDRHQDEESDAVDLGLREVFPQQANQLCSLYLKQTDFLGLYYHPETNLPRIGLPLFFPNTCRVEEGRRGVSSPVLLNTDSDSLGPKYPGNEGLIDLIGAKDRAGHTSNRLSLGEVTSMSELFPFVNSTVYMGTDVGTYMDGGVYENMGLTTLYEIRASIEAIRKSPDLAALAKACPDSVQQKTLLLLLAKLKFKFVLIYNTEHLDHNENPGHDRTIQFFDPITTLLKTPFGGHTDYIYHKTKLDFAGDGIVEFPLQAVNKDSTKAKDYDQKAYEEIVMSRWLSRYDMKLVMERSKELVLKKRNELER